MHCQGLMGFFFNKIGTCKHHIKHHIDVSISQDLLDATDVERTVFTLQHSLAVVILAILILTPIWYLMGMNKYFKLWILIVFIVIYMLLNQWIWNSIHTAFHKIYVPTNVPIRNPTTGENVTIWGLPPFVPNPSNPIYKYYYKHHAIHHLSKGESKCNYNIIQLGFDVIAGTNKSNIDNRAYFAKHAPQNKQEEWLARHPVFDIKIGDDNIVYYRDTNSNLIWNKLPVGLEKP
jgi:hypothetical protein